MPEAEISEVSKNIKKKKKGRRGVFNLLIEGKNTNICLHVQKSFFLIEAYVNWMGHYTITVHNSWQSP